MLKRPELIFFLLTAAAFALKKPDAFYNPQFWGEDALIFFLDANTLGFFGSIIKPYAGYLHTLPRIIAWIASLFNACYQPLIFSLLFVLVAAGALTVVFNAVKQAKLGFLIALAPILVFSYGETVNNLTNLHWYLAYSMPFLFLVKNPSRFHYLYLFLVSITGPFCIFLMPAFLLTTAYNRFEQKKVLMLGACAVGVTIQGYFMRNTVEGVLNIANLKHLHSVFMDKVAGELFFGTPLKRIKGGWRIVLQSIASIALLVLFIKSYKDRITYLVLLLTLILLCIVLIRIQDINMGLPDRYFLLPKAGLFAFIAYSFSAITGKIMKKAVAIYLIVIVTNGLFSYKISPFTNFHWRKECRYWGGSKPRQIKINPNWMLEYKPGQ